MKLTGVLLKRKLYPYFKRILFGQMCFFVGFCICSSTFVSFFLGKMTKYHSQIFWDKVVKTNVDNGVLLLDSWGGQKPEIFEDGTGILIKTIPPNTTGMIQPCDVYFFRYDLISFSLVKI